MNRRILVGILFGIVFSLNIGLAETMPGVHFNQTGYQLVNNDVRIEFLPTGDKYMISEVFLRYRPFGEIDYQQIRMKPNGLKYVAVIDQEELPTRTFEYEFAITDRKGNSYLYAASEYGDLPFRFSTQQQDNKEESERVDAVVISPLDGETVNESDFIGVVSILGIPQNFSLVRTKIFIDGIDYTGDGNIGENIITFTPSSLEPGLHTVTIQFYGADGSQLNNLEWDFTMLRSVAARSTSKLFSVKGRGYINNRYENLKNGDYVKNYLRGGVDFSGQLAMFDYGGRFYLSSEESENLQATNIYNVWARLGFNENWYVQLSGIDNYPNYNKKVVKDTRFRGIGGTAKIGYIELSAVYGSSRRATTGMVDYVPLSTDPVSGDTTFVENAYAYSYQRNDIAGRLGVGSLNGLMVGLSVYKGKDDEATFDVEGGSGASLALSGTKPRENMVAGVDFSLKLFNRKVEFFGVGAVSSMNNDIRGGTVPFDTLEKYMTNIDDEFKQYYDIVSQFMTVGTGIESDPGVSFEGGIKLRLFGNFLQAKYEMANKQFNSFGLQYIRNDYDAIRLSDGLALMENKLTLNLGYDLIRSNKSLDNSIRTNQIFFNVGYNPSQSLPSINLNFTNLDRQSEKDTALPIDETFRTIGISGGYLVNLFGIGNSLNVTYSQSTREDANTTIANTTANVLNFTVRSRFDFPLTTRISVDKNLTDTGNETTFINSDFTAVTVGANYLFAKIFKNWDIEIGGYGKIGNITNETNFVASNDIVRNLMNFTGTLDMKKLGRIYSGFDYYTYSTSALSSDDVIWTTRYSINF